MKNDKTNRASMFLSFDSLKGFKNCLKEKERIVVDKKELMIDAYEELNWKIHQIKIGSMVHIVYYDKDDYVSLQGIVTDIDLEYNKSIKIVEKEIPILDIVKIDE